jgi:Rrf2 family protein
MAAASSRFATAIHVAAMMAGNPAEPVTSDHIAASVNTNPVVIRRLMSGLKAAGIVGSQSGASGGFVLKRQPAEITLGAIFRAVECAKLFRVHPDPSPNCPYGKAIERVMTKVSGEAEIALLKTLDGWTLTDVMADVQQAPA